MRMLLEAMGYVVRDYDSARRFLAEGAPPAQCLVVDQHMPGMTGLELLEQLRAYGDLTPVFIVTGRAEAVIEQRACRVAAAKVLSKPVPEEKLIALIDAACGSR